MSNSQAYKAAAENYVQLVLFDSNRKIHWKSSTTPNELTSQLLDDYIHKFFASLSISSALFDGISSSIPKKEENNHHVYLNRRRITLPNRNHALVINTRSGNVISGYPMSISAEDTLWLGLFSKGFSATNEDFCVLLENIAFAAEILPPLHLDSLVARFDYLSTIFTRADDIDIDIANDNQNHTSIQHRNDEDSYDDGDNDIHTHSHIYNCLKNLLRTFSSSHTEFITYPPSSLSLGVFSPSSKIPVYDRSILESLRPSKFPVRSPWWVVAACVLTKDGVILKAEGASRAISRILYWRYTCFSIEDKRLSGNSRSGLQEYRNGVLLRAWYTLGPIGLCILTSQAVSTQTSVTREDLENLAKRSFKLLEKVKKYYAA